MSRPLRIGCSGAIYYLTLRGNACGEIFLDDTDREIFLDVLGSVVEGFGWRVHAHCLMENHYHLLVQTPQPNLSRGMRRLNGVYTQRFNRRHERSGSRIGPHGRVCCQARAERVERSATRRYAARISATRTHSRKSHAMWTLITRP